eukprot:11245078-Ditylum_brightwellii.AAC.1
MEEMGSSSIGPQEVTGFIHHTTASPSRVIVSEDWPVWLLVLQSLDFWVTHIYTAQMSLQKIFKHKTCHHMEGSLQFACTIMKIHSHVDYFIILPGSCCLCQLHDLPLHWKHLHHSETCGVTTMSMWLGRPKYLAPMTDPAPASYPQRVWHVLSIVNLGYALSCYPPDNSDEKFPGAHWIQEGLLHLDH